MPYIERSREAEAFLDARQHGAPEGVSACEGWTAHEVTAHLAAAAAEIVRHPEPYLDGRPVPATRSSEEREPPYRAMMTPGCCGAWTRRRSGCARPSGGYWTASPAQ